MKTPNGIGFYELFQVNFIEISNAVALRHCKKLYSQWGECDRIREWKKKDEGHTRVT